MVYCLHGTTVEQLKRGDEYMSPKVSCNIQKGKKGYTVNFRHSVVKDKDGKYGLKVHRGLGTTDAAEAQRLAEELERILSDSYWADSSKRTEAYGHFSEVVVDAYYDPLEGANPIDEDLLNRIKLPSKEDGYARQTFVGPSGVGKTSLLRLMAGTGMEKFPTTSTGRTTTCNLELIMSEDADYEIVVTFMSRYLVEMYVLECIEAALEFCISEKCEDLEKKRNDISNRLFTNRDLIFRMSYIIGDLSLEDKKTDQLDEEFEEEDIEKAPMNIQQDIEGLLESVNSYIDCLIQIAQDKYENNIDIGDETFNSAEENDILSLRNGIVEDIMARFRLLEGGEKLNTKGKWTNAWYFKTEDREEFIRTIKRFTSNNWRAWGSLLSPIVKTMRVKGRFKPEFCEEVPRLVLFDGQGLGHKTAMSSMPTNVIEYFRKSDGIVIVDNAQQPILENVKMAIRTAIEYGYSEKVCFAFTHMDLMAGDNFGNFSDKRHHIWAALDSYISDMRRQNKDVLSETEAVQMMGACFYFSGLNSQGITKVSKKYGNDLIALWKDKLRKSITVDMISLSYDMMTLIAHLKEGIKNYRTAWGNKIGYPTKKEETVHWSKVRALTRRLGYFGEDNYQLELMPLADFSASIRTQLNIYLNRPMKVEPNIAEEDKKIILINAIKSTINGKLQDFVKSEMWDEPDQLQRWKDAYDYAGKGSTVKRAVKVNEIFEFAAPQIDLFYYNMTDAQKMYISKVIDIVEGTLEQYRCKLERFQF